jgi:hypothetical protein
MMLNGSSGAIATRGFGGDPVAERLEVDELAGDAVPGHRRRCVRVDKGDWRGTVGDHRDDRRRRGRRSDRGGNAAGAKRAKKDGGIVDRGRADDRDGVALADAIALQRGGDPVHQRIKRGVIDLPIGLGQRDLVAVFLRMGADQVGKGGEVAGEENCGGHEASFRNPEVRVC